MITARMDTDRTDASLDTIDWGLTEYEDALERQKNMVDRRRNGQAVDTLILTEHTPVYTIGLRKGADQHLIWDKTQLAVQGVRVSRSNRGGDITYHGPGQLIGYPIICLQQRRDLHAYLRDLETVVIRTLAGFGLKTSRRNGKTGIWLDHRKICAIGIAVRTWVAYHGFALNVNPKMSHFSGIIPCGISDGSVTSMQTELGETIDLDLVKARLTVEFQTVFRNTAVSYEQS